MNQTEPDLLIVRVSRRRALRLLYLAALFTFTLYALFLGMTPKAVSGEPGSRTSQIEAPDPCGLDVVDCPGRPAEASPGPQASDQRVIQATVYTYQAVSEQTDSTPCQGAMAGIDFCDPPFSIVANNCLPLGTAVEIRGARYYVHDRMNARYGCDVFDVLTAPGDNYRLINEPVTILTNAPQT